jgi:hypothetical protein
MGYISFTPGVTPDLLDATKRVITPALIKMTKDVPTGLFISDRLFLKPPFITIPAGSPFVSFDLTFEIDSAYVSAFRLGNTPASGTSLHTGQTWHNMNSYTGFLIPFQICTIAPVAFNIIDFDITIVTRDGTATVSVPLGPFQYNIK